MTLRGICTLPLEIDSGLPTPPARTFFSPAPSRKPARMKRTACSPQAFQSLSPTQESKANQKELPPYFLQLDLALDPHPEAKRIRKEI